MKMLFVGTSDPSEKEEQEIITSAYSEIALSTAADVGEAIDKLAIGDFDFAVSGLNIAYHTNAGLSVIAQARKAGITTPILLFTSHPVDTVLQKAGKALLEIDPDDIFYRGAASIHDVVRHAEIKFGDLSVMRIKRRLALRILAA